MPPPVAKKVRHEMEMFGDVRIDDYYWLRRLPLRSRGTKSLEDEIYAELRGRIKEDDISAPVRRGPYYYYRLTLEGKEYVQHCRRLVSNDGALASVHDVMQTGPDAPPEQVILDENIKAQDHTYYRIGAFRVSPNNKLIAYAEDTKGDEIYTIFVIDAETRTPVGKPLVGVTSDIEWAGNEALAYSTMDEILRPDKAWLHKLEADQSSDTCLYHEKDDMFSLVLEASESKKYLFVASESKITRFVFYIDISEPGKGLTVLTPRLDGMIHQSAIVGIISSYKGEVRSFSIQNYLDAHWTTHLQPQFFFPTVKGITLISNSLIMGSGNIVKIQDIRLFSDHVVAYERENGLPRVTIYRLPAVGEPLESLQDGRTVDFIDPVLGGFDSSNYVTERKWATAADGTQIPISVAYRKDLVKLDGSDPLLLYGYGSYEGVPFVDVLTTMLDPTIPLTTSEWEEWGDPRKEEYYFYMKSYFPVDNIAAQKYPAILVTAGLNGKSTVSDNAFHFLLTAEGYFLYRTSDEADHEEKVEESAEEDVPSGYEEDAPCLSPLALAVGDLSALRLPFTFDSNSRVMYSEPAKFVAKLRDVKTDDNVLLFECELGAGHSSKSGR
ncbi:hypothetical protein RJ640_029097 [Escallonia rubra]|uniref:Prolyl endopeptidase-like n=1 Tax=Escallonia rubra TaxID=112253 RepID=A0AA88RXE4_9ASTE|nr:hypothetical protein RJ640_029097 [Escallonia rubra]